MMSIDPPRGQIQKQRRGRISSEESNARKNSSYIGDQIKHVISCNLELATDAQACMHAILFSAHSSGICSHLGNLATPGLVCISPKQTGR